jgi:antitoxin FitA
MAANLHVRNLDDDLIARLKRRASRHGRSTEAEHREILRQALASEVEPSFDTLAAELRKLTRRRKQTPSEDLLREGGRGAVNTFVIGASIAVKWMVEENGTAEALVFRQNAKLIAPQLLVAECATPSCSLSSSDKCE